MRHFYTDIVGLDEIYASMEDRTVGYRIGDLQLAIISNPGTSPVEEWARQLGWEGGTGSSPSWGVELDPAQFREAAERVLSAHVPTRFPEPQWVGYWSFPIRDPMGYTVELSATDRGAWHSDGADDA